MSLIYSYNMKTEIIGIWDGDYRNVVSLLCCKCKEIHIRTQGKKLIVKDIGREFYGCFVLGDAIEIPYYGPCKDITETVALWDGDYEKAESLLLSKNPLLIIKLQGKKISIRDTELDFYVCIPLGDAIQIPVYNSEEDDDPPLILEEPMTEQKKASLSAEQEQLMRKWGLLK